MGSRRNNDAKDNEGGSNNHLTKNIRENMDWSKYTWCKILVQQNNGNIKLRRIGWGTSEAPKIANMDARVKLILILTLTQAGKI